MAPEFTQPVTEMSTGRFLVVKRGRRVSQLTMASGFTQPVQEMSAGRFLEVKRGRRVSLTTLPKYVSLLSKKCGILNISQLYRPPRPVTWIALLYGDRVCYL
jgi:hypothetical protein